MRVFRYAPLAAFLVVVLAGASIGDSHPKGSSESFSGLGGTIAAARGPAPYSPAPVNYWKFDTTNGTTWTDTIGSGTLTGGSSSSSSPNFTTTNSPAIVGNAGRLSPAISQTGGAAFAANSSAVLPPGPCTIAGWFTLNSNTHFGTQSLFGKSGFSQDFRLSYNQFAIEFWWGTSKTTITQQFPPTFGVMHHYAVTFNGTTGGTLYYDGSPYSTYTSPGPNSGSIFTLGGDQGFGDNGSSDMTADEMAVWNVVLTNAQVSDLYNRGLAGTPIK